MGPPSWSKWKLRKSETRFHVASMSISSLVLASLFYSYGVSGLFAFGGSIPISPWRYSI
jgi:hypothetical protein